jgi:hypothetical protein
MTDKERVLAKHPEAYSHCYAGWWYIDISRTTPMLGEGPDEDAAWADAAREKDEEEEEEAS